MESEMHDQSNDQNYNEARDYITPDLNQDHSLMRDNMLDKTLDLQEVAQIQQQSMNLQEDNTLTDNDQDDDNDNTNERERKQNQTPKPSIKTRRQSRGIVYFNRKNPTQEITIGSLEEWFQENQLNKHKRRKLNTQFTLDEKESRMQQDDYIELDQAKIQGSSSKLNKTFLYENWYDDFEKNRRKEERNKKRKRSEINNISNRSRSRSPTPVSKSAPLVSQADIIMSNRKSRKGPSSAQSENSDYQQDVLKQNTEPQLPNIKSLKEEEKGQSQQTKQKRNDNKEVTKKTQNQTKQNSKSNNNKQTVDQKTKVNSNKGSQLSKQSQNKDEEESEYDSEEEDRKETEKIKVEIMNELEKKEEPLDIQYLSTTLKYTQKHIEEGLKTLMGESKIIKKEIGKKTYFMSINQEPIRNYQQNKAAILEKVTKLKDLEKTNNLYESDLQKLEKQLKDLKLKPTANQVQNDIQSLIDQIHQIKQEIDEFKHSPQFLGDHILLKLRQMYHKLDKLIDLYKKRKDGCVDMLDYFAQHLNLELQEIVRKCGIDQNDLELTPELIEILGIDPEDLKKKEEEESEEVDDEEDEEDSEEEDKQSKKKVKPQPKPRTTNNSSRRRKTSFQEEDIEDVDSETDESGKSAGDVSKKQSQKQTPSKQQQNKSKQNAPKGAVTNNKLQNKNASSIDQIMSEDDMKSKDD